MAGRRGGASVKNPHLSGGHAWTEETRRQQQPHPSLVFCGSRARWSRRCAFTRPRRRHCPRPQVSGSATPPPDSKVPVLHIDGAWHHWPPSRCTPALPVPAPPDHGTGGNIKIREWMSLTTRSCRFSGSMVLSHSLRALGGTVSEDLNQQSARA
ncbi:hypothetical protein SETIT_3G245000v2 [Setaria italica]|uniref:Uncharacterized protein n=1 Tax=Setaria italica TaxID=4555 RepID=A0A368QIP3_SETIT|nr:hypothetical protein SETIT_3G245000v2 [Setaria italica]RCV17751.1 hypothetical protein SETIT_3G245000v2 [Setaria italica]RCV17752.1 hypothetical protein SETIT_3G245000v2 [Setaria italica]RCV17753.1 hypothetical protein SETIT_3G245000v2 [Setaria italica]